MPPSLRSVRSALWSIVPLLLVNLSGFSAAQQDSASPLSEFPHTAVVRGQVVDQQGRPVAGARVMLTGVKGKVPPIDSYAALLETLSTQTNDQGEFRLAVRFAGDEPLRVSRMGVEAQGFARVEDKRPSAIPPGGEAVIEFVLQPGEILAGRVHPLAAGLKNALFFRNHEASFYVLRIQGKGFDQTCLTQPGGRFEFYAPPGAYTISLPDADAQVEARAGSKDILLIGKLTPEPPQKLRDAFAALWSDMDRNYSYFVHKPNVDWNKLREEFQPRIEACGSREEFVLELVRLLERLEDMHIWLEYQGQTYGAYQKPWSRNWNLEAVGRELAESKAIGNFAQVGTTREDGFGYVAVFQLQAQPGEVEQLLEEMERRRDAPGFLLDLRMCAGGSEPIAQRIAGWFAPQETVYAMHAYRNGPQHDDFSPRWTRTLAAAASPYKRPVVCLTGARTMSSAEAFVLMMKTLPHATTVGAATRGASGNPKPFALPGLDIHVWYSRWVAMDAAGQVFEGTGIAPDVTVPGGSSEPFEGDPTFAQALATLRSKLAE